MFRVPVSWYAAAGVRTTNGLDSPVSRVKSRLPRAAAECQVFWRCDRAPRPALLKKASSQSPYREKSLDLGP